jgi:hypothetical protein
MKPLQSVARIVSMCQLSSSQILKCFSRSNGANDPKGTNHVSIKVIPVQKISVFLQVIQFNMLTEIHITELLMQHITIECNKTLSGLPACII